MFYHYDTLLNRAKALGLTSEADEIAKTKAAVVAVEGTSPTLTYLADDANGNRRNIAELDRQAQRYSELGIEWLAVIRKAEAEQVSAHLGNIVGLERMVEENRERSQRAREQSLKDLQRVLEVRAGTGVRAITPPVANSTLPSAPTTSRPTQSGDKRVWDNTNYQNCVDYRADARKSDNNMQWYTITNTCTTAIKVWVDDNSVTDAFGSLSELAPGRSSRSWWLISTRPTISWIVCRQTAASGEDMHIEKKVRTCYHYPK